MDTISEEKINRREVKRDKNIPIDKIYYLI